MIRKKKGKQIAAFLLAVTMSLSGFGNLITAKAATTTAVTFGASGSQSGSPDKLLIATTVRSDANGSDGQAAFVADETATGTLAQTGSPLGEARVGYLNFNLESGLKADKIESATVNLNIDSVHTAIANDKGSFKTKAGLFQVTADPATVDTADASTYPAADNDYSYAKTIYSNELIGKGYTGSMTFDVTDLVKTAVTAGEDHVSFRLQTVISGFVVTATGENAPALNITKTKSTVTDFVGASGSQSGAPDAYLVSTTTKTNTAGSNGQAAYVEGTTATGAGTQLGENRVAYLRFSLDGKSIADGDKAVVTVNVTSVNNNIGNYKTKGGLFAVTADPDSVDATNEATYPAKDNDYSYAATVYSNELIGKGYTGTMTFDVTDMVKEAVARGDNYASFRLQTVVSGFTISAAEGSAPALTITTAAELVEAKKEPLQTAVNNAAGIKNVLSTYATISQKTFTRAYDRVNALLAKDAADLSQDEIDAALTMLDAAKSSMVKKKVNEKRYTSVPVGQTWLDTEGAPIQAHGGGFLQQTDTDGKPIYYWVGEDKSHNTSNFNGISLYSSKDLLNWTYRNTILAPDAENAGLSDNKIERPKLVYNEKTKKYVLWGHWEDKSGYSSSQICVATCDTVDGDYTYLGHWRPGADDAHKNWRKNSTEAVFDDGTKISDYSDSSVWGTGSRDFTIYMEDNGVDAYIVSAEDHSTMRIYKLNDDFTDVVKEGSVQLFNGAKREAPALVKIGEYYYMISSAQSGWMPNQTRYSYTKNLMDPSAWSVDTNGRPDGFIGNNTSFYSQPTNIMQVSGSEGTSYIYMGDRWNSKALGSSTYVWLPLTIDNSNADKPVMKMDYHAGWSLNVETGKVVVNEAALISEGKTVTTNAKEASADNLKLARASDGDYTNANISGGNHAYFKPVTEAGGTTVKMPFDYTIDLGGVYDLSRMDLSFNCHNGSEAYHQYTIDTSMDNTNWTTIVDESANTTVGFKSHDLTANQARYVRLSVSKAAKFSDNSSASWAAGLVEVQVYGSKAEHAIVTEHLGLTAQVYKVAGKDYANNVMLRWEDTDKATEYKVYRSTSKTSLKALNDKVELVTTTKDGTAYEDTNLKRTTRKLYYQVVGYADGEIVSKTDIAEAQTYANMPENMSSYACANGEGPDLSDGIYVDGKYYSYYLTAKDDGWNVRGMERVSTDNKTWKDNGAILTQDDDESLKDCKFESVSVLYNKEYNKVVIWAHYEKKSGYATGAMICVSGTPGDPDSFTYSGLIFPNGVQARDKCVFVDDDNTAYLVAAGNESGEGANRTMYIHKLTKDWTNVDESQGYVAKLFEGQYREAPAMVKVDGVYYLFTSKAAGWLPSQGMYASTKDLYGDWSDLRLVGNMSSFAGQQNGAATIKGDQSTNNGFVSASRWWRASGTPGWVSTPTTFNEGFASTEFYNKVYYDRKSGVVIPERSGEVISQGKKATFNGADAKETVDGDYQTKTVAEKTWPAIWQVDLEKQYDLKELEVSWYMVNGSEAHYPYIVYGSNTGKDGDWTKILDKSDATLANNVCDYGFTSAELSGSYRYVRVEIVKSRPQNNQGANWYTPQLWEVKVLGDAKVAEAATEGKSDQELADEVIDKIAEIGEVTLNDASKAKIDEARKAYDDLTDTQKDLVYNAGDLTDAENTYKQLAGDGKDDSGKDDSGKDDGGNGDKKDDSGTNDPKQDDNTKDNGNNSANNGNTVTPSTGNTDTGNSTTGSEDSRIPTQDVILNNNPGIPSGNAEESKNAVFNLLTARVTKSTKTTNTVKWKKVKEADGYIVLGNRCNAGGKKYKYQVITVIDKNTTTSYKHKKLTKGTYYKYMVQAYKMVDGKLEILATSKTIHVTTAGGKWGNVGSLKLNTKGVQLKTGAKFKLKATEIKKDKQFKRHRNVAYESTNPKVASVSKKGVIKAKKKGTCYIYAYAQNGIYKKIKVTVKK